MSSEPSCTGYTGPGPRPAEKPRPLSKHDEETISGGTQAGKQKSQSRETHTPSDIEKATKDNRTSTEAIHYVITEEELLELGKQRDDARMRLSEVTAELENSRQQLYHAVAERNELEEDAQGYKRLWKKLGSELDNLRAMSQGFYQITDNYLIEQIQHVRHSIQGFAIQYFDGNILKINKSTRRGEFDKYMEETTPHSINYLRASDKRIKIIQAFLWCVLRGEIFDQFLWLGSPEAERMRALTWSVMLNPEINKSIQAHRKFRIWSATSVELLLAAVDQTKVQGDMKRKQAEITAKIETTIGPFAKEDRTGFQTQLRDIVDSALQLDQEICRQVPKIEWPVSRDREFDAAIMEIDADDSMPPKGSVVRLSLAPGVRKWGKSTGEDFEVQTLLLKEVVTCK